MEWLTLILTVLVGAISLRYFLLWRKLDKLKELGVLHPRAWPLLGNSGSVLFRRKHFSEMIESLYRMNEAADYIGFYDFQEPVIMIRSPELLKTVTVKNFDHFTDHRGFLDADSESLFSKNLFLLCGERWKEMRNLLSPAFTSSKMRNMFQLMSICGKSFVDCLEQYSSKKSNIVNTKDIFTRYTNDVIATCAFGLSVDSMKNPENDFYMMGKDATNLSGIRALKLLLARLSPRLANLLKISITSKETETYFENIVRETIEARDKNGITRPDMLQLMMESRGKRADGSEKLTIRDMTAQAFIFFFGGFESSATAMCFVAHEIALDSKVQAKLCDEIDEVLAECNGDVTYELINGMEYLEAVINEALRLYPINLFLERLCVKKFELPPAFPNGKPITIEPGQNVLYPTLSIQRDPKYFPNPEKFDPERFMGSAKSNVNPLTYIPFGIGPRMCIANRFALLEIKVLIFHLLSKYNLKPRPEATSPAVLSKKGFIMMPKDGFWVEIEARNPQIEE